MSNIKIENLSHDADLDIEAMETVTGGYAFLRNLGNRKFFFGVKPTFVRKARRPFFFPAPRTGGGFRRRSMGRYID